MDCLHKIRQAYIGFRLRRLWECAKDRKIRMAQKFMMKLLKGRYTEQYGGLQWSQRGLLTIFRAKSCIAMYAAVIGEKNRAICKTHLTQYFAKTGQKMVILDCFLQFNLDSK